MSGLLGQKKIHSSKTTLCYQQRKVMVTVQTWLALHAF